MAGRDSLATALADRGRRRERFETELREVCRTVGIELAATASTDVEREASRCDAWLLDELDRVPLAAACDAFTLVVRTTLWHGRLDGADLEAEATGGEHVLWRTADAMGAPALTRLLRARREAEAGLFALAYAALLVLRATERIHERLLPGAADALTVYARVDDDLPLRVGSIG